MPYTKKVVARKVRRPRFRRRTRGRRVPLGRLRPSNVLTVVRTGAADVHSHQILAAQGDTYYGNALTFQISDFNNISEFENVFDQFRINWVKVNFMFAGTSMNITDTYFTFMPFRLAYAVDYDDNVAPASTQAGWLHLNERKGCQTKVVIGKNSNNVIAKKFTPRMNQMIWQTSSLSGYVPMKPRFIDMSNKAAQHYGLKYCLMVPKSADGHDIVLRYDITVQYCVSFQGVH